MSYERMKTILNLAEKNSVNIKTNSDFAKYSKTLEL